MIMILGHLTLFLSTVSQSQLVTLLLTMNTTACIKSNLLREISNGTRIIWRFKAIQTK